MRYPLAVDMSPGCVHVRACSAHGRSRLLDLAAVIDAARKDGHHVLVATRFSQRHDLAVALRTSWHGDDQVTFVSASTLAELTAAVFRYRRAGTVLVVCDVRDVTTERLSLRRLDVRVCRWLRAAAGGNDAALVKLSGSRRETLPVAVRGRDVPCVVVVGAEHFDAGWLVNANGAAGKVRTDRMLLRFASSVSVLEDFNYCADEVCAVGRWVKHRSVPGVRFGLRRSGSLTQMWHAAS